MFGEHNTVYFFFLVKHSHDLYARAAVKTKNESPYWNISFEFLWNKGDQREREGEKEKIGFLLDRLLDEGKTCRIVAHRVEDDADDF